MLGMTLTNPVMENVATIFAICRQLRCTYEWVIFDLRSPKFVSKVVSVRPEKSLLEQTWEPTNSTQSGFVCGIEIEARVSPESKLRHLITWKVNGWIKLIFLIVFIQFVCHPYSQLALNSEVYKNVPYLEKSSWKQAVLLLLAAVAFPLLFLVWLVADLCCPNHSISRMFHSPCVKFLITCGSYQTFLFLLALTSFHSSQSDEFLEYSVVGM